MIQTTNKYSKETFIRLNYWYDRIHGLVQEDIDKVNTMVEHIEKTRSDRYPRTGDNLFFVSGYGERSRMFFIDAVYGDNIILRDFSRVPFVSRDKEGIKCDMHGGECLLVKAGDVRFKAWTTGRFKHWGHYGACESGEVYYDAKVSLWECTASEQPESREWFKIHIRKTPGRARICTSEKYPVRMRMDSNSLSTIMKVPYSQKRILRKWSCCVSGIPT